MEVWAGGELRGVGEGVGAAGNSGVWGRMGVDG